MVAHVIKPYCIDEICTIQGKDVKEILRGNEPSWINEFKVVGFFAVVGAFVVLGRYALYMNR
jgi:hypothetical protein